MFRTGKGNEKKLLDRIEDQEQKLVRYETRLRDVVQAYKSLQNEKEALESTVNALSSTSAQEGRKKVKKNENQKNNSSDPLNVSYPTEDAHTEFSQEDDVTAINKKEDSSEGNDEEKQNGNYNETEELDHLHEKISTLSKALATVTQEKSKMEAAFQADRKLAMQEHEKRLRESEEQMENLETKNAELEKNLLELKSRLRQQQSELQIEQENNAVMLKEMQQLLSAERLEKEELKIRLHERREGDKSLDSKKTYEAKIQNLSDELASVSSKLKQFECDASQPSSLLLQISEEMIALKKYHSDAIRKEQNRANEAEEALRRFSLMEEQRIAQLETKLTELSDVVSSYEKLRYQDQAVIHKLKDKLSHLDSTNPSTPQQPLSPIYNEFKGNNQLSDLKEQVLKLKGLLRLAWNSKDDFSQQIEPVTAAELDNILHDDPIHRACQLEYKQLKDEFENYKKETRKNIVRHQPQLDGNQELTISRQKSQDLEKELNSLRSWIDEKERDYIETISNLQCEVTEIGEKSKSEIDKLHETYKLDILNLEAQIVRQRERTLQLLADKDAEISRLKGDELVSPTERRKLDSMLEHGGNLGTEVLADPEHIAKRSVETEVAVRQLLVRQNSAGSEGALVYYRQQISQLQNEIASIRSQNNELESQLRDEEHREEQFVEQMKTLKEEVRRLERNRTRESANMEYIKNIFLRYMLTDSHSVKLQLTTAISTVLQFSPSEVNELRKKQHGWWSSQ